MPRDHARNWPRRPTRVSRCRMAGCVLIGMASCVATPWSLEDAREAKRGDASNRGCCRRRASRSPASRSSRGAATPSSRCVTAKARRKSRPRHPAEGHRQREASQRKDGAPRRRGPYFVSAEIHLDSDDPHDKGDIAHVGNRRHQEHRRVPVGRRPRTRGVDVAASRRSTSPPTAPSSRERASGSTPARPRRRSSVSTNRASGENVALPSGKDCSDL